MPKSVTMTHAESSSTEFNLVKTPPYDSDADMTDEEILEGLMEITSLSPPDTLEDEPTYE